MEPCCHAAKKGDHVYNFQTRKRAERSIARYGRKKHEAILDCPFREVGAIVVFTPPGLEDGGVPVGETGGIGGSATHHYHSGQGTEPQLVACSQE